MLSVTHLLRGTQLLKSLTKRLTYTWGFTGTAESFSPNSAAQSIFQYDPPCGLVIAMQPLQFLQLFLHPAATGISAMSLAAPLYNQLCQGFTPIRPSHSFYVIIIPAAKKQEKISHPQRCYGILLAVSANHLAGFTAFPQCSENSAIIPLSSAVTPVLRAFPGFSFMHRAFWLLGWPRLRWSAQL